MGDIFVIKQPEGTLPTDETFAYNEGRFGATWNVSLMKRAIMAGTLKGTFARSNFTESFIAALKNVDLNRERIDNMTQQELDAPLLSVMRLDGLAVCVDGNHRAQARIDRGLKDYRLVLIYEPDDHPYRIEFLSGPSLSTLRPIDPEKITKTGWGTFPQHKGKA